MPEVPSSRGGAPTESPLRFHLEKNCGTGEGCLERVPSGRADSPLHGRRNSMTPVASKPNVRMASNTVASAITFVQVTSARVLASVDAELRSSAAETSPAAFIIAELLFSATRALRMAASLVTPARPYAAAWWWLGAELTVGHLRTRSNVVEPGSEAEIQCGDGQRRRNLAGREPQAWRQRGTQGFRVIDVNKNHESSLS